MKAICSLATLSLALMLSSCAITQQKAADAAAAEPNAEQAADSAAPREKTEAPAPVPTEEQQKAAEELLPDPAADAPTLDAPGPCDAASTSTLPSGGLRMGSITPQEDPASVGEAPPPTANAAERFGLRSPKMPSQLPMNIDGKIQNAQ